MFIPLFLMSGYVGLLFREFAVTVSVSLVLSLLISLTLTPMMCSRLLKPESKEHGWLYRLFERGFDGLLNLYDGSKVVLRHRFTTLMVMLGTIALTGCLYVVISQGLLSPAGHGIYHRLVRGGAGHFVPGDGGAPASFAQCRDARPGRGIRRFGGRCRRRQHHCQ